MEKIEFNKVSLIINKNTPLEKTILKNISFDIESNKIISILGSSNSGKTAILELLSGLMNPTKGTIKLSSSKDFSKKNIGYLFKNPYDMFFCKTVYDELAFALYNFKYKKEEIDTRVNNVIKMVGLKEECLKLCPLDLTLNDAKKVALASIIIYNPEVILIDEITIGLRKEEKDKIIRLLNLLKNKFKKTIIIATKDVDFSYQISDEVYLMNLTKFIKRGSTEILRDKELLKTCGLNVPKIVSFIEEAREKGIKLEDYKDIKDLIKGVYRSVF